MNNSQVLNQCFAAGRGARGVAESEASRLLDYVTCDANYRIL